MFQLPRLRSVLIPVLVLAGLAARAGGDEFALMKSEAIGALKLGQPRSQALALLPGSPKAGPVEEWGADGQFHQQLDFKAAGVRLSLVSEHRRSAQTVEAITITAPCLLASQRGIHIGSSLAELRQAYQHEYNREDSQPGVQFVAGSIYGGLCFQLHQGRVSQIFLGAAAE